MVILGSQAELHQNGMHLLLRTYFSDGCYAYLVHNLHGGLPVGLCDERFETPEEAMRKAEDIAARALGTPIAEIHWRPIRWVI